jgi:hypothetical protein
MLINVSIDDVLSITAFSDVNVCIDRLFSIRAVAITLNFMHAPCMLFTGSNNKHDG